jgi:hypothetical protein
VIPKVPTHAQASTDTDRSIGVVVSFDSKWYETIVVREVSLVIRKRIPITRKPDWLYFHVNSPKSAICARAPILSVEPVPVKTVHTFTTELCLDRISIDRYCGVLNEIGTYKLGVIELAPVEATISSIRDHLDYSPPQSFMFMSDHAKEILDKLCGFG